MQHAPASRRPTGKAAAAAARPSASGRRAGKVPYQELVADLAFHFRQPPERPDPPLVVINRIPQTRSVHALVIWDKWRDLAIPERSRVIADAFVAAFPDEDVVVRFPMGLTSGEAFAQGYLPYQIMPLVRPTDGVSSTALKQAMNAAGGVRVQVGGDMQLRFATRGQASEAYRRLVERINKPIWTLSEETSSSNSEGEPS